MKRREFLVAALTSGAQITLVSGLGPWACRRSERGSDRPWTPNVWIRVEPTGLVTIFLARSEMGQGVTGALPLLVAEELDAAWESVRVEPAPLDAGYGPQSTTASMSVFRGWEPLRKAGAAARQMLVAAAAERWGVPRESCRTREGIVHGPRSRTLPYGELTEAAARQAVPQTPTLKAPGEWRLIGTDRRRPDIPGKVNGSAKFGADIRLPGMLYAAIAHSPVFGGRPASFDAPAARAIPGVVVVVKLDDAVAVVAESFWTAKKALAVLNLRWDDDGGKAGPDSTDIQSRLARAIREPQMLVARQGDVGPLLTHVAWFEATYEVPFLAHACMEPVNCTATVGPGQCTVWAPTQSPTATREAVAKLTGLPVERVDLKTTLLGGGFGRKSDFDFVLEAVRLAQAVQRPVQLIWSREEDIQHDRYRPAFLQRLRAGLDRDGMPLRWTHHLAGPPVRTWWRPPAPRGEPDGISVAGADSLPYAVPGLEARAQMVETGVPLGIWRSIGHSYTCFAQESFIDELATAAHRDPLDYRLSLLRIPRAREVLTTAAEKAGWGRPLPAGQGWGMALSTEENPEDGYNLYVAQVALVAVGSDRAIRVLKIVCAADIGVVLHPGGAVAQMEGGIIFGLTAALHGEITLRRGRVQQSNFHDYPLLRMDETPEIEVHLARSSERPSGAGEKGVSAVAPAVANAVFAATGQRLRRLPLRLAP